MICIYLFYLKLISGSVQEMQKLILTFRNVPQDLYTPTFCWSPFHPLVSQYLTLLEPDLLIV